MWRLTSGTNAHAWVGWEDDEGGMGRMVGSEVVIEAIAELIDTEAQVALTPTGPFRDVLSTDDQVGVYLFARDVLGDPVILTGTPPVEDTELAEIPEGAVS